ncbi:hypothetical protein AMELA_G00129760 [Ameiurus melas]|uniref:Uncharacterized protein n=1 Tax=Ameiurus melas TaxID=219545 RepID=A0A7J6AP04_AMEME|nr:hypothetical protein AMELA_G00129760 [Ameiurus melas]
MSFHQSGVMRSQMMSFRCDCDVFRRRKTPEPDAVSQTSRWNHNNLRPASHSKLTLEQSNMLYADVELQDMTTAVAPCTLQWDMHLESKDYRMNTFWKF